MRKTFFLALFALLCAHAQAQKKHFLNGIWKPENFEKSARYIRIEYQDKSEFYFYVITDDNVRLRGSIWVLPDSELKVYEKDGSVSKMELAMLSQTQLSLAGVTYNRVGDLTYRPIFPKPKEISYKGILDDTPISANLIDAKEYDKCKLFFIDADKQLTLQGGRFEKVGGDSYLFTTEIEGKQVSIVLRDVSKELKQPKLTTFLGSFGVLNNTQNRKQIALFRQPE